jgi:hypothetical protein
MNHVEYMISRTLRLLITQDLSTSKENVDPHHLNFQASDREVESSIRPVYQVIHSLRFVEVAIQQFLPVCDYDLPIRVQLSRKIDRIEQKGQLDISASLSAGAIGRRSGVFLEKQIAYENTDSIYIATVLLEIMRSASDALSATSLPLREGSKLKIADINPTIRGITERLRCRALELQLAVRKRPHLHYLVKQASVKSSLNTHLKFLEKVRARSAIVARRIHKQLKGGSSELLLGSRFDEKVTNIKSKLYEFWCFCELTYRLRESSKLDIVQRSFLRTGSNSPTFLLGNGGYVYYEHRTNCFTPPGHVRQQLNKLNPERGPEWIICFPDQTRGPAIIDCKYYTRRTSGMLDSISTYCLDYNASLGIGFTTTNLKKRGSIESSKWYQSQLHGNSGIRRIDICLQPNPNCEQKNQELLDKLILELDLSSRANASKC